ncbi:hypothetical protein AMTR_s00099p00131750 [Amborella trichopoda]|uniref:Uncharacterized protein n=1 Tax=Amborella trichopoda TaxID=13333 RepID=W1NWR5_AMBTC|nr:hypothetical protein AMTR_s00099p00131750 [Amborella trichopoda]
MTSNSYDHVGKVGITENGCFDAIEYLEIWEISKKQEVQYIEDEKCIKDEPVVEQKISSRELENGSNENASFLNLESDYNFGKETVDSKVNDFRD